MAGSGSRSSVRFIASFARCGAPVRPTWSSAMRLTSLLARPCPATARAAPDLAHRKAELAGPADEAQGVDVASVEPIAGLGAAGRRGIRPSSRSGGSSWPRRRSAPRLADVDGVAEAVSAVIARLLPPAPQQQRVGDHADAGERHRRAGQHRVQQAERGQRNADQVVDERPEQVLLDLARRCGARCRWRRRPAPDRRASA